MAGESEEISMLPYQIYQALTDQRTRDLMAAARHRELLAAAKHQHHDLTEPSSRLREVAAQMVALLHVRRGARSRSAVSSLRSSGSTMTSATGAGPMGCSA
jgi:hypothetical protein